MKLRVCLLFAVLASGRTAVWVAHPAGVGIYIGGLGM